MIKNINTSQKIKIIIVGAGKGGKALIEFFQTDPLIEVIGVVDIDENAAGIIQAKKSGIPTSDNFLNFLENPEPELDLIIEVTGNKSVEEEVFIRKPPETRMIAGIGARFIWQLLEERTNSEYLEKRFNAIKGSNSSKKNDLLFGSSPLMQNIRAMVNQVAPTFSTVLLNGETGTGKEMIAQAIFDNSHKTKQPFIKVNCTAFTPEIIESELFGHVKGAFTGAMVNKIGILEKAHGGTLFLDEIGDVPMHMQVKLLRFLQFGEIRPVGSNETKHVEVRIIAATNQKLEDLIEKGLFRKDLFFRLNTFTIELPPLRDRKEDIPLYAYHFLKIAMLQLNKKVEKITSESLDVLIRYDWPGNLRELQGVIERAIILTNSNTIEPTNLPISMQDNVPTDYHSGFKSIKKTFLSEFERNAIHHYLHEADGNISKAAAIAKLPRRSFYRILDKYGIKAKKLS